MKSLFKQFVAHYLTFWARLVISERRPQIVGVTGSVGKTTTKEAIAAVLSLASKEGLLGTIGKSEHSLNSELGLPLAVLRFQKSPGTSLLRWLIVFFVAPYRVFLYTTIANYPRILVLEYAADRPGDISRLVRLAPPMVACLTAVGPAHLERFGTVKGVAREKSNLIRAVGRTGLVVLPRDDRQAAALKTVCQARVVLVRGRGVALAQAMALQVGRYFKIPTSLAQQALKGFQGLHGRLEMKHFGSWTVIDDTYNANPLSMGLALDTLAKVKARRVRKVAILGEMRELGSESATYHQEVGELARQRADVVMGIGELARNYRPDQWYPTSRQAAAAIGKDLKPKDRILVKGSRGVHMERVVEAIRQHGKKAAPKGRTL